MTTGPRIVLWDIETSHNLAAVFQLFRNDYIPHDNIVQERYIICASWKVLGEKQTHAVSVLDSPALYKKNPHSDLFVVKTLLRVLSEADVIVAHYGDRFDLKYLNARAIINGLQKLPPMKTVDTKTVASKHFLFNSNKLDYLGQALGVGRKIKTEPGLWLRVLKGDRTAVEKMVRYNKGDVRLLERVFLKLRPYMTESINQHLYQQGDKCPRCGSKNVQSRGVYRAITRAYQRYACTDCGGWFRGDLITGKTSTRLVA